MMTAALTAGAAAVFYLIKRSRKAKSAMPREQAFSKQSRHLIKAFSRAKQNISGIQDTSLHQG